MKIRSPFAVSFFTLLLGMTACGSPSPDADLQPDDALAQQIQRGGELYGQNCADCHGSQGEGNARAPRLVGSGAFPVNAAPGRKRPGAFHSAMDVAGFVVKSMPPSPEMRAQISSAEYFSILAFALAANGVKLDRPLDAELARAVILNPK